MKEKLILAGIILVVVIVANIATAVAMKKVKFLNEM